MKLNINAIRKELHKLHERRQQVQQDIECLQYELKQLEAAMVPLKQAHDSLAKLTGADPLPTRTTTVKAKPEAIAARQDMVQFTDDIDIPVIPKFKGAGKTWPQSCHRCEQDFEKTHPRQTICPTCKAAES